MNSYYRSPQCFIVAENQAAVRQAFMYPVMGQALLREQPRARACRTTEVSKIFLLSSFTSFSVLGSNVGQKTFKATLQGNIASYL